MKSKINKKPQLFIFHFAGGNCYSLIFLEPFLKDDFKLFFLELPGRGKRFNEPFVANIDEAIEDYYEQILTMIDLNRSHFIYGHSMGAVLALRVAEKLEKKGENLKTVITSGCSTTHLSQSKSRHLLDKNDFKNELISLGGITHEVLNNSDLFDFFEPIIRNDFKVLEVSPLFNSNFKISTPIFSIMGSNESGVSKIKEWSQYTLSDFKYKVFDGGHFFINKYPSELSKIIRSEALL